MREPLHRFDLSPEPFVASGVLKPLQGAFHSGFPVLNMKNVSGAALGKRLNILPVAPNL
jgi:hypothetical protein